MTTATQKFKVGDRVVCLSDSFANCELSAGKEYTVLKMNYNDVHLDGVRSSWLASRFALVVPTSPIRTVTKREIVPGRYGDVTIEHWHTPGYVTLATDHIYDAVRLREAARIFYEIADVLDEQKAVV